MAIAPAEIEVAPAPPAADDRQPLTQNARVRQRILVGNPATLFGSGPVCV